MFKVRNWTSERSRYFSANFCKRGNSSRQNRHQEAQKLRKVTLPLSAARFQSLPVTSLISNGGNGSLTCFQAIAEVSAAAGRPYQVCHPSLVPPSLVQRR